jgi:hypothetical protein
VTVTTAAPSAAAGGGEQFVLRHLAEAVQHRGVHLLTHLDPPGNPYDVWVDMLARTSRPGFLALLLERAGVTLDPELAQYLVTVDLRGPIGVLELSRLTRSSPTASSC